MPDSATGLDEMPLYDMPAGPASIRQAADRRRLQRRFLRAGRDAVDDRDLLELLLSGRPAVDDASALAAILLDLFGTAPRALTVKLVTTGGGGGGGTGVAGLRGSFEGIPGSHDGTTPFEVRFRFAEDIVSPAANVEASVLVTGGTMSNFAAVSGSVRLFRMDITPEPGQPVIRIYMRGSDSCSATRAICTADDKLFKQQVVRQVSTADDARLRGFWLTRGAPGLARIPNSARRGRRTGRRYPTAPSSSPCTPRPTPAGCRWR